MVGVIVGHRHGPQPVDTHALQLIRRTAPGIHIAVAGAAVHHHRLIPGIQQGTLSLPHIHRHGVHLSAAAEPDIESHRQQQGHGRQRCRHGVFPPPLPGDGASGEEGVGVHQPVFEITVGKIQRMARQTGQSRRHPQDIPHQRPHAPTQHPCRRKPEKARQRRHERQHEAPSRRRKDEQIAQRRYEGKCVEVTGRQRDGEHHGRQRSGEIGGHEGHHRPHRPLLPPVQPLEKAAQPLGEAHQSQRGSEAQLQAHPRCSEGIGQQDHQQRRQAGKPVALPAQQRSRQQEYLHDAGPDHRGCQTHHHHIKQQHRHREPRPQRPPPDGEQQPQQGHQKGTVQPRYGEQMGHPRLRHDGSVLLRHTAAVAGQLRRDEGRRVTVGPYGGDLLPQGVHRPLGQPPDASGAALLRRQRSTGIQQSEHAP